MSEKCFSRLSFPACFVPDDKTLPEIALNKFVTIAKDSGGDTTNNYIYVRADDPAMTPVTLADLGVGAIEDRPCHNDFELIPSNCWVIDENENRLSDYEIAYQIKYTSDGQIGGSSQIVLQGGVVVPLPSNYQIVCEAKPVDTCFLPNQYAIVWAWNGSGDIMSYNPLDQTWTDYGKTQLPDATTVGGFSMDVNNDATNPSLIFQRSGKLYKSPLDNPTQLTEIGSANNSQFASSYPCGAFDPSGRYLIGIGSGSTVGEVNITTGAVTTLGVLTDWRDGAPLQAGPGDWFFDPAGNWFLMARDTRGASFVNPITGNPYSTGTVLWQIDASTLEVTRVGNTESPSSGTGAGWFQAGQYLLSTSNGNIYTYQANADPVDPTPSAWVNTIPQAPHAINDLGNEWVIPEAIRVVGCTTTLADGTCSLKLSQLVSDQDTAEISCQEFVPTLAGKFGVCEPEPNPYVSDPFSPTSSDSDSKNPDEVWHEGCSDAGLTLWRRSCDPAGNTFTEYIYSNLDEPTSSKPEGFSFIACGANPTLTETTQWCNEDNTPNTAVFRKEFNDGSVLWFDETGEIPEPVSKSAGECQDLSPLLPVSEQIICFEDEVYVRVVKETYVENADGLPELDSYQILYYNENGTLWDSGVLAAGTPVPAGEPTGWTLGDCVAEFREIRYEKLCEIDARFLLLIDSGGVFGRYSFFTKTWETVNTLSVASAGGSADVENFLLYNFVAPDQMTVIDVNTDTQLPNVTLIDGVINPAVATNPKTFSAASFRSSDGYLYAQDTAGADAGLYRVNVTTGEVDFVTGISGVSGTGTSIAINNTTDTLYVNGSSGRVYQVDWLTGVGTLVATAPITANGSTFDTDGNLYVSSANDTYYLPAGADGTVSDNWIQIIDDFGAGANSIAYYEVVAPEPSCFFRKFGIPDDPLADPIRISDHNVADFSTRTIVGDVGCCESCSCGNDGGGSGSTGPTVLDVPTTTVTNWNESSSYTTDIEAHPVAFPEGYFPPVHIQGEEVTYYTGGGVYNGPNGGNYGIQGNGDGADVTKVWFPESAVLPVENINGVTLNIPTTTIVDFNVNNANSTDGPAQDLADNGYTTDVNAIPIAVPAGSELPVKLGGFEQEYYSGNNTFRSTFVNARVAFPSSHILRTESEVPTISVYDADDSDGHGNTGGFYTKDISANPVAFPADYVAPVTLIQNKRQEYYQGDGNVGSTEVDAKVALPLSYVQKSEIQIPTTTIVDFDQNDRNSDDIAIDVLVANGYTKDVDGIPIVVPAGSQLPVRLGGFEQEYYAGNGNTNITSVNAKVAFPTSHVLRVEPQVPEEVRLTGNRNKQTLAANGTTTVNIPLADAARNVEVILEIDTCVDIVYTHANGDTVTHSIFGGTHIREIKQQESPVTRVVVSEQDGVSTRVIVNWESCNFNRP